jgi:hypothetical protein
MVLELIYNQLVFLTFGIMSTLVTQFLELLLIIHDNAGYHLRLWGFRKGRHGSTLKPTINIGFAVLITMFIGLITVPIIFNYFQVLAYAYLNTLNWKLPVLFLSEFSFTLFWLIHFVKRKISWDKWKIGSLIMSIIFFIIFLFIK